MEKCLISIIIPVFNSEKHLVQCLESVINQTLTDIEIICVNDGSKDNSLEILNKYATKDKRISVINTENKGPSHARNKGMEIAKGKYIQFVDADDWIVKNLCQTVFENAQKNDSDIVIFNGNSFDNNKKITQPKKFFDLLMWENHVNENSKHTFKDYEGSIMSGNLSVWNKLYKKEFLQKNQIIFPENISGIEDYYFHLNTFLNAQIITLIDKYLYNYRVIQSFTITSHFAKSDNIFQTFALADSIDELYKKKRFDEIYKYVLLEFKCHLLHFWYIKCAWKNKKKFYKKCREYLINIDLKNYDLFLLSKSDYFQIYDDFISNNFLTYYFKNLILDCKFLNLRAKLNFIKKLTGALYE
ncbi:MAG TPA: glycosyltransferase [Candidatus Gastranaerophilaceae bacterium]|nr:glycosyltransferase [Candidatus Gastranaerophilaceae bacterium]